MYAFTSSDYQRPSFQMLQKQLQLFQSKQRRDKRWVINSAGVDRRVLGLGGTAMRRGPTDPAGS